jgi:hypothetical protein
MKPLARALVALMVCAALTPHASAAFVVFTDRTAFNAAAGPGTTETFTTPRTLVVGDNIYNSVNYRITGTTVGFNSIGGGVFNGDEFTTNSLDIVFPVPVRAFGADFTSAATSSGLTFTILGQTFSLGSSLPPPGTGFFGIVSTDPFTTVDVGGGPVPNETYVMDNLTFVPAAAVAVPAPPTLVLAFTGFLAALARRRVRIAA